MRKPSLIIVVFALLACFVVELAHCEHAETGKLIDWPSSSQTPTPPPDERSRFANPSGGMDQRPIHDAGERKIAEFGGPTTAGADCV